MPTFDVRTDHQIVAFDADRMILFDSHTADTVATAVRENGIWTVHAGDVADAQVDNRNDAIDTMIDHALRVPGAKSGYSTLVPHGLRDLP